MTRGLLKVSDAAPLLGSAAEAGAGLEEPERPPAASVTETAVAAAATAMTMARFLFERSMSIRSVACAACLTAVNANGGERAVRAGPAGGPGASVRMGR
jgi:hypothetical protein